MPQYTGHIQEQMCKHSQENISGRGLQRPDLIAKRKGSLDNTGETEVFKAEQYKECKKAACNSLMQ